MTFHNPRLSGAFLLAMSVVCVGLNFLMMRFDGTFSAKLFMAACACVLVGPFIMVVGSPTSTEAGKPPFWKWRSIRFATPLRVAAGRTARNGARGAVWQRDAAHRAGLLAAP